MRGEIIDAATDGPIVGLIRFGAGVVLGLQCRVCNHGAVDRVGGNLKSFGEPLDHLGLRELDAEVGPRDLQT